MSRSERAKLIELARRKLHALSGKNRFVPMWARLHVFKKNPALYDERGQPIDTLGMENTPPIAVGDYFVPGPVDGCFGGLWDTTHQRWVEDARPESADQVAVFPCTPKQVGFITFREPKVLRVMKLGGPGTGKTRGLSYFSIFHGGGLLERKGHLNWGMVAPTHERAFSPMFTDLFGDPETPAAEPGVVPDSWIVEAEGSARASKPMFARLANGCHFDFRTGQISSNLRGSKVQGLSWHGASVDETQNVHDKVQRDIDERGRRTSRFLVGETATNLIKSGHFALRLERYKESPYHRIIRVGTKDNVFVHDLHWERLRASMSESEAATRLDADEDAGAENRVYSEFVYSEHVQPRPLDGGMLEDVTYELTLAKFGRGFVKIAATDFGKVTTVTLWLKAYRHKRTRKVYWWIIGEVTSRSHTSTREHGLKLIAQEKDRDSWVAICDPAINSRDADKSDYEQFRRLQIHTHAANFEPIRIKHRVNMLKGLLKTGGEVFLFIDCDRTRTPVAKELVKSFLIQDKPDDEYRKDTGNFFGDPTHWPAATAYGVYPFEQIRATTPTIQEIMDAGGTDDPVLHKAREIAARRGSGGGYGYGN